MGDGGALKSSTEGEAFFAKIGGDLSGRDITDVK